MIKKVACTALVLWLVALFVLSTAPPANAQAVYGSIIGSVTDPQGAAVPNAKVTITDVRKGTSDTATTNESGNYTVTHLIPDIYDIKIEAQGFKTAEQKGITVMADQASRNDIKMSLGSVSEAVEVTAEAPQLKTDRADVATTFNEKYVQDLPVLGRNFTSFLLLSPGTQLLQGWNHASTENPQGSQQTFVNGQHFSGTGYELDGTDNQDPILGIIVVNPNLDAITETKIDLQDYDAEFGKAVAGIVTVQTKSGSNDFHGEGFWFRRTDATEARNPFTQYAPDSVTGRFIPEDRWNQFGGTFGGPIIKNKLFFFADYQGTRQASGITQQLTIPSAQVLNSCTGAGDGSGYCKLDQYVNAGLFNNLPGGNPLIYDPTTGTIGADGNPVGRTPFCGPAGCDTQPNWIPLNRIPTQVQNMLSLFPTPTNSALQNNLIASGSAPFSQNSMDARVDWAAGQTVSVFGRFSMARYSLSGEGVLGALGGVGTGLGGLAGSSVTHNYSVASGVTKTFSPTLLADFRFGYFKYNPHTHKPDEGATPMQDAGIPNVNFGDVFTSGWGSFQFGPNGNLFSNFGDGLNVGRCNCPLIESEQQFQFVNNWTKIHGNHTFKFGLDMRYAMNLRVPSDADRAGVYNFNNGSATSDGTAGGGAGFADFLLGYVDNFNRFVSLSLNAAERQKRFFYYGQDTWRATQKLTINYGLRWEIYFPETVNGKDNGGFANPEEGIIRVAGEGKYDLNGNIANSWKALAPRLGIAYQVTPKTVVRMGYGRSFDIGVFGSNFGHAVTQNLPVLVNQTLTASTNTAQSYAVIGMTPPNGTTLTDQYYPAFSLSQGPPVYEFPAIPSNGVLPLGGPQGNVQPRMRPTFQRLPTLDAWNLTVQRQLTNTMSLEVAYVGNKGTHVFAGNGPSYDLNQVAYGAGTGVVTGDLPVGTSCSTAGANCKLTFTPSVPANNRKPFFNKFDYTSIGFPGVTCCSGNIMGNYFGNDSSSNYNALQVKFEKRFSQGLQFQTNFTWSKAFNHSADNGFLYSVDPQGSYGPDDFNRDKVWIFNAVYQLPFGRGKRFAGGAGRALDLIIGGWQITDTTNLSSGLPWTPYDATCNADTGPCLPNSVGGSFHTGTSGFDPVTHTVTFFTPVTPIIQSATIGEDTCSNTIASGPFGLAPCGAQGLIGRNSMRGPGAFTDNMSISKDFKLTERFNAQFRMDAFNVFNHPILDFSSNEGGGGTCIDCGGNNGQIQNIAFGTTMRQLQFGLKLIF
ncbi:MAG TPA: TonB-dependent receptor [Terriglobales bacterium]|nr:TonB-dependent receptor [Terriglobales bacterium]